MTSLKLVKAAHMENHDGIITIIHYDTTIYEYNPTTKRAWALMDCSPTSNRQISHANNFFKPTLIKAENNAIKNEYSRSL